MQQPREGLWNIFSRRNKIGVAWISKKGDTITELIRTNEAVPFEVEHKWVPAQNADEAKARSAFQRGTYTNVYEVTYQVKSLL